jgi:hypothetical protein
VEFSRVTKLPNSFSILAFSVSASVLVSGLLTLSLAVIILSVMPVLALLYEVEAADKELPPP